MRNALFFVVTAVLSLTGYTQKDSFRLLCEKFVMQYDQLSIPETDLDYTVNFSRISDSTRLLSQKIFFTSFRARLDSLPLQALTHKEKIRYKQLLYECNVSLERIALELDWRKNGMMVPSEGLFSMNNGKAWYAYYIKLFTSTSLTPEEIHNYGLNEVKRIQGELDSVRKVLKCQDEKDFYLLLQQDSFYLDDKNTIASAYSAIDKTVRRNLPSLFYNYEIPEVGVMEWPGAGAFTPPGIYLSADNNPYGKDVFQYNFYNQRHNRNNMEWLFLHEAIPGHHMQSAVRRSVNNEALQNRFFYFGNAEGWACYIEDLGEKLGLYKNSYSYAGKLRWDLVRSARLVIETGIHYYGWTKQQCKSYWMENIKAQDEIAEREISRVTNWPAQSLCYKAGALYIKKIIGRYDDIKTAHQYLLEHSDCPLEIL